VRLGRGTNDLQAGDVFGSYTVLERLGEGAMGTVYKATRNGDGAPVALKLVKQEHAADGVYRQRFLHEARAASEVSHPHLVNVVDAGEVEGRQYLAMRLITGRPLDELVKAGELLEPAAAAQLATQIGDALDALHAKGVVHRDVKAANILLQDDGTAALTDFGLAKGTGYAGLTAVGQIVGTIEYLAPERIVGEEASPASDLYALGCVVYESLVGRTPFAGKGPMGTAFGHLEEDPPDPRLARADLPPWFGASVLTALMKDPAERPPTARDYGEGLLQALAESG
jgi:serine/threonine protein kinase